MKAYLIDAKAREVREVEVNGLEDWQRMVGGEKGKVYVQDCRFRWLPKHTVLVDEDGKVRDPLPYGFHFQDAGGSPYLGGERINGNGLLVKDTRPHFSAPDISIESVRAMVGWWGGENKKGMPFLIPLNALVIGVDDSISTEELQSDMRSAFEAAGASIRLRAFQKAYRTLDYSHIGATLGQLCVDPWLTLMDKLYWSIPSDKRDPAVDIERTLSTKVAIRVYGKDELLEGLGELKATWRAVKKPKAYRQTVDLSKLTPEEREAFLKASGGQRMIVTDLPPETT